MVVRNAVYVIIILSTTLPDVRAVRKHIKLMLGEDMNTCKGVHDRFKASDIDYSKVHKGFGIYLQGYRRCRICYVFLDKQYQRRCPCCSGRLKTRPIKKVDKVKFLQQLVH